MKYTRGGKVLYHIKLCERRCKLLKCNKLRVYENEETVAHKKGRDITSAHKNTDKLIFFAQIFVYLKKKFE